jgi:hypothetical protein
MGEAATLKVHGEKDLSIYQARLADPETGRKKKSQARAISVAAAEACSGLPTRAGRSGYTRSPRRSTRLYPDPLSACILRARYLTLTPVG